MARGIGDGGRAPSPRDVEETWQCSCEKAIGMMPMSLTELPFGLPGCLFRSPMPLGPYDLHGEVYDRWCEEQIAVIVLLASDENVSRRQAAICERCTSKRASRCSICPFLISGFQPSTTWNRQFNKRLPMLKQDAISSFTAQRALGVLDCLPLIWRNGAWGSLVLRLSSGYDAIFPTPWKHQHNNGWSSTTTQAEDSPSRELLTHLVLTSYGRIDREWQRVPPEE